MNYAIEHKQSIANLIFAVKAHAEFEACLQKQVASKVLSEDTAEILLHDYLNETSGLFDEEYFQLKDALSDFIEDDNTVAGFDSSTFNVFNATHDAQEALAFLSKAWEDSKEAVTLQVITEDQCCDHFADILHAHNIDYSAFIDLCNLEWVESE